jgi:hypothetical protein
MRETGEPWLATRQTPATGSDLATDDAVPPTVTAVVDYGVSTAIDHLGSVVDAIDPPGRPIRHWAPYTALRTALLSASRVVWVLTPDDSDQRKLRAAQIRYINADEQRKAIDGFAYGPSDPALDQKRQQASASMSAEMASLEAQINALGSTALRPSDTVQMLRDLVDMSTWEGMGISNLWRTGSAAAHGYHWTDTTRTNPEEFDEQSFNLAFYGATLMVWRAFDLYNQRAAA